MKRVRVAVFVMALLAITLVNLVGVFADWGPKNANAETGGAKDPHHHVDNWTVCHNEMEQSCG